MRKKYNYGMIKDNFIYTTDELAELLKVHRGSIQRLINKENMPVIDKTQKPFLLKGRDTKEFLKNRARKNKIKLEYYEFICMRCKKAVQSIPEKIDFEIFDKRMGETAHKATVKGVCIDCDSKLIRFTTDQKIEAIVEYYTTTKQPELGLLCNEVSSIIV